MITVLGRWLEGRIAAPDPAMPGGVPEPQNHPSETCSDEWQALEKTHSGAMYLGRDKPLDQLPDKGGQAECFAPADKRVVQLAWGQQLH